MTGAELIAQERQRQITEEGWTDDHDDNHGSDVLAKAAAWYALPDKLRKALVEGSGIRWSCWPFDWTWYKPTPDDRVRELVKAGALIAAEIDRLGRCSERALP